MPKVIKNQRKYEGVYLSHLQRKRILVRQSWLYATLPYMFNHGYLGCSLDLAPISPIKLPRIISLRSRANPNRPARLNLSSIQMTRKLK